MAKSNIMSQKQYLLKDDVLLRVIESLIAMATSDELQTIYKVNSTQYHRMLTQKYQEFSLTYPGLFNTIVDNPKNFDMGRLKQMLEMKKRVKERELSYEEASTKIGQQYYDEFAKPLVDESQERK